MEELISSCATFKMGAMKTESPVSIKTKIPVTLCSLGKKDIDQSVIAIFCELFYVLFFFNSSYNKVLSLEKRKSKTNMQMSLRKLCFQQRLDLPHTKELGLLPGG